MGPASGEDVPDAERRFEGVWEGDSPDQWWLITSRNVVLWPVAMTHRHRTRQRAPNSRKMIPTFCTTSRLVMIPRIDGNLSSCRETALAIRRPWELAVSCEALSGPDSLETCCAAGGERRNDRWRCRRRLLCRHTSAVSVARTNASSFRKESFPCGRNGPRVLRAGGDAPRAAPPEVYCSHQLTARVMAFPATGEAWAVFVSSSPLWGFTMSRDPRWSVSSVHIHWRRTLRRSPG